MIKGLTTIILVLATVYFISILGEAIVQAKYDVLQFIRQIKGVI